MKPISAAAAGVAALCLSTVACRSSYYHWGDYDASVATMQTPGAGFDVAAHVDAMARDLEQAEQRGRRIAPGLRAHLGFLLLGAGNRDHGLALLRAEAIAFPESSIFVDQLIAMTGSPR